MESHWIRSSGTKRISLAGSFGDVQCRISTSYMIMIVGLRWSIGVKKGMHQFVATFWETTGFGIFLRDFCGIFLRDFCDFHLSLGVWLAQFAEIFPKSTRISPKIRGSFGNIPGKLGKNMNKTHHFPSQRPRFRAPGAPSAPASARDQWPWQWLQIPKASPGFRMVVSCG